MKGIWSRISHFLMNNLETAENLGSPIVKTSNKIDRSNSHVTVFWWDVF